MNVAQAYGKLCVAKFEEARKFVNVLGGAYKANFDNKVKEAADFAAKADNDNAKIYYEPKLDLAEMAAPDP